MTQKPQNGSYAGTQSIIRSIRILKAFKDDRPEWTLAELVEATGLNKTTAFRLLSALESERLVRRTADGGYRLGSEMIALGGRAIRATQLRTIAHFPLRDLAQQTGETTTLELLRPDDRGRLTTLVIDETLGRFRVGITQYIGSRLPVHATSSGKVMLAFSPGETVRHVVKYRLTRFTDHTLASAADLRADLVKARRRGYALAEGELEIGVMAAAGPIFDHMGMVQAAISVVGPTIRVNRQQLEKFGELVRETTAKISQELGYRPA